MDKEPSLTIRIYWKEWKFLRELFPAMENESAAMYLRRYMKEAVRHE